MLALCNGDPRPRARGDLADRLPGRDRHGHGAREGEDRRHPREADPRGARRGADRPRRRLPGRLDGSRHHDARARRVGHDRRGAGRGARSGGLRDLHGRGRRLHGRSPDRAKRAQAARGQLRRDAGDGSVGCAGAAAAVGRVRAQPRCQAARAVELLRGGRHVDSRGGRTDAREGAHLRRDAQVGGERLPRGGRVGRAALRSARRRRDQRRHGRPDGAGDRLLGATSARRPTRLSRAWAWNGRPATTSAR